ncbi:MAG: hypothetical protein M1827_004808 [Pycnora praestabilis]|nr:MAG: hypothetical protein M1827_004808 [Pycnora praestabilis]
MPLPDSSSGTPSRTSIATSPYLSQLQELDTPVPDLASTLFTQVAGDAEHDNVNFLRTRPPYPSDTSAADSGRRHQPDLTVGEYDRLESEDRRRIRRATTSANRRRYTPEQLQELEDLTHPPAYGERVPHQQSLYDWAPGASGNNDNEQEDDAASGLPTLSQLRAEANVEANPAQDARHTAALGQSIPVTTTSGRTYASQIPELHRSSQSSDSTLRTAALLQSVRRHSRFSSRSRNQLQNYILEREQTGRDAETRESSTNTRSYRPLNATAANLEAQRQQHLELRARVDAYRQRYLENPSSATTNTRPPTDNTPVPPRRWLQETITYLERLRFSSSHEASLLSAAEVGFVGSELFTFNDDWEDFISDTTNIEAPPESSWLEVGSEFSGSQYAGQGNANFFYRMNNSWTSRSTSQPLPRVPRTVPDGSESNNTDQSRPSWLTGTGGTSSSQHDEKWPVKVTINSVDYSTMTLSGTMEAFNVPNASSPSQESSIVTFLEGEIIDFNTHTLQTKTYESDAKIDGTYWRKLGPFKDLTDTQIVKNLVSKRWLVETLVKNWILMRWKEKCFITPSDYRSGLTISGFYYVSLRRDSGHIEGLYYDPSSSPYQYLSLTPEKKTFPTYEFR